VPVRLNAVPWAEVQVDGVRRGNTPLRDLLLAAGPHEVVLRHPPDGTTRRFVIDIAADAAQTFLFDLRQNSVVQRSGSE